MMPNPNSNTQWVLVPKGLLVLGLVLTILAFGLFKLAYSMILRRRQLSEFPLVSIEGKTPLDSWLYNGLQVLAEASQRYDEGFQVMTGTGPKIILPNRFADELCNSTDLAFTRSLVKDFFVNYPGFEPFREGLHDDGLFQEMVRVKLTRSLGTVVEILVDEIKAVLPEIYGENYDEWQTTSVNGSVADVVVRLTSRVYLGSNLCRNPLWVKIGKSYTSDVFIAAKQLRIIPRFLRPLAHWFIPSCRVVRTTVHTAHRLIGPEVQRRRQNAHEALLATGKTPKAADSIAWMHEIAITRGYEVDYVASQLMLTLASTHTTVNATALGLIEACSRPNVLEALRKEIVEVIGRHGWNKATLYKLKYMDSFLKETQRFVPQNAASMNRWVERDIKLSNGKTLPRNTRIMVSGNYRDPKVYPEPDKFDAARFLKMRQQQPRRESNWQLVSTSSDHMLFGHGLHACPGRFFATNLIKIALCHLLLKYDWRFEPGESGPPPPTVSEVGSSVNYAARLQFRRRREEVVLDNLM